MSSGMNRISNFLGTRRRQKRNLSHSVQARQSGTKIVPKEEKGGGRLLIWPDIGTDLHFDVRPEIELDIWPILAGYLSGYRAPNLAGYLDGHLAVYSRPETRPDAWTDIRLDLQPDI